MTTLLLIDVQNDFHPGGSLAIPTASSDAARTAAFIRTHTSTIARIVCTMDSHHKLHIAHPSFWTSGCSRDGGGERQQHPAPFTIISSEDVRGRKWIPRDDLTYPIGEELVDDAVLARSYIVPSGMRSADGSLDITQYCIEYTRRLEEKGRFQLCIWPEHCLIGSQGHNVVPIVMDAIQEWSDATGGSVEWVHKGQNLLTEMYSALSSEVPISESTDYNYGLLESLREQVVGTAAGRLVVCGQALSHCVNYTVRDIVEHWPKDEMGKLILLNDCASSVPGFEEAGDLFLKDMVEAGVTVESSEAFQP